MSRNRRRAFSLMEVLLATSILLASLLVLGQMAVVGRQHAEDAESLTTAQLLCQAKMNELLIGATQLEDQSQTPIPEMPGWIYDVSVGPRESYGLISIRVSVYRDPNSSLSHRRGKSFSLVRWIHQSNSAVGALSGETDLGLDFDFGNN